MAAAQAVKLWEAALQQLGKLPTTKGNPEQRVDITCGYLSAASTFLELPKVNASVFNKLAALKVRSPLQATVCSRAVCLQQLEATAAAGSTMTNALPACVTTAVPHSGCRSSSPGPCAALWQRCGSSRQLGSFGASQSHQLISTPRCTRTGTQPPCSQPP
jgi:hypothetical protein